MLRILRLIRSKCANIAKQVEATKCDQIKISCDYRDVIISTLGNLNSVIHLLFKFKFVVCEVVNLLSKFAHLNRIVLDRI